jgi:hypothetical protein
VTLDRSELRALVREVVRDAVSDLLPPASSPVPAPAHGPTGSVQTGAQPTGPLTADQKTRIDTVRIATDEDLNTFVRQLLRLFENPKTRGDLRNGRLSFRFVGTSNGTHPPAHRIDRGAVTERHIADLAASGGGLVLGRRAVLTPLAREKARALGITIHKERK